MFVKVCGITSEHDALLAGDGVDLVPELVDPAADVIDLLLRRSQLHRDNHDLPQNEKPTLSSGFGLSIDALGNLRHSTGR